MEITNELLAAYAEGNVTPEERKAVREYLTEHPSLLESVMMMMDEDYEIDMKPSQKDISFCGAPPKIRDISLSSAAYAPSSVGCVLDETDSFCPTSPSTFDERLDDLLDEINN